MGTSLLIKLKSNSAVITVRNDLRDRYMIVNKLFPRSGRKQKSAKNPNFTLFAEKQTVWKVLPERFHLNGHTTGFFTQTPE